MHRLQQMPGRHPLYRGLLQPGVLCHRLPQVSPPHRVWCGTQLREPPPRLISVLSLTEATLLSAQPVASPSSPQRSVCLGSPAGQPGLPPLGRDGEQAAWPPMGGGGAEECTPRRFPCDSALWVITLTPTSGPGLVQQPPWAQASSLFSQSREGDFL